jgi:hypothetical protein
MPSYHDLVSQPAKGRYFAYPHAALRKLLRELEFSDLVSGNHFVLDYVNDRRSYKVGYSVADFRPRTYFRINSFADEIDPALATKVIQVTLEQFRHYDQHHRPPRPSPKHVTAVANYCEVYLEIAQRKLTVIERIMHRTRARFRATAKVCHAYKSPWRTMKRAIIKEVLL